MTTAKEVDKYLARRVTNYKESIDHYERLAVSSPFLSAQYSDKIQRAKGALEALESVEYYIEHGTEHPDLIAEVVKSEALENPVE